MYIMEVKSEKGKTCGIGMKNKDGNLVMIAEFSLEMKRKYFIFKDKKITYKKVSLSSDQYKECLVVGELGSLEKVVVFEMLDDHFKQMFSEYYEKELLSTDLFWDKIKSFIADRKLSFLELAVIHELFREGIAKENIVGFEIMLGSQRVSFNLSDRSSVDTLMGITHSSINKAKRLTSGYRHNILQGLCAQILNVKL